MDIEGLLGNWGKWTGDPEKDSAIQQGLLSTGLAMMGGRGSTGQIIGQAGMQGMNTFGQVMQETKANKMRDLQLKMTQQGFQDQQDARQRQRTLENLPARNMKAPASMDNRDVGQPGEQRPEMDLAGLSSDMMATPGGFERGYDLQQQLRAKKAPLKASAGDTFLDPETFKPIAAIPEKPAADPAAIQEYKFAQGQGYKGSFEQWDTGRKRAGATNISTTTYGTPLPVTLPDGTQGFVQPGNRAGAPPQLMRLDGSPLRPPPKDARPPTEAQAKAQLYGAQMQHAEKELSGTPIDLTKLGSQADVGAASGWTNIAASPVAQRARQAQNQWAEAFLRAKTGAAATAEEVKLNVETYFPKFGDDTQVVQQKKRARDDAVRQVQQLGRGEQVSEPAAATGGWSITPVK